MNDEGKTKQGISKGKQWDEDLKRARGKRRKKNAQCNVVVEVKTLRVSAVMSGRMVFSPATTTSTGFTSSPAPDNSGSCTIMT